MKKYAERVDGLVVRLNSYDWRNGYVAAKREAAAIADEADAEIAKLRSLAAAVCSAWVYRQAAAIHAQDETFEQYDAAMWKAQRDLDAHLKENSNG